MINNKLMQFIAVMVIATFEAQSLALAIARDKFIGEQPGNLRPRAFADRGKPVLPTLNPGDKRQPEFIYYTRDENGNLLKEPSGFPGRWTAEIKIHVAINRTAVITRTVKSFAVSAQAVGRSDIRQAHFTIERSLPRRGEDTVFESELVSINKSERYGLVITATPGFLSLGIAGQRQLFSEVISALPKGISFTPVTRPAVVPYDAATARRLCVILFNQPTAQGEETKAVTSSVFSLASLLKKNGFPVQISNLNMGKDKKKRKKLKGRLRALLRNTDVAGISVYDSTLHGTKEFIALLKEVKPEIIVIVGGPSATIMPEHTASYLEQANVIYRGEAEAQLVPLLLELGSLDMEHLSAEALSDGLRDRRGLAVQFSGRRGLVPALRKAKGEGRFFSFCDYMDVPRIDAPALNEIPFDFSFINGENLDSAFTIMTSRGCVWHCAFCATGSGKQYRAMSPERVIEIMMDYQGRLEELEAEGVEIPPQAWYACILDDNFLHDHARALAIFELWRKAMKEDGLRVKIFAIQAGLYSFAKKGPDRKGPYGKMRPALIPDSDFIQAIGSYEDIFYDRPLVKIGTEAFVTEELKRLGKPPYDYELIEGVMAECEKCGVRNMHYLILTNADTSIKDLLLTIFRIGALSAQYELSAVEGFNMGIVPNITTHATNELVEKSGHLRSLAQEAPLFQAEKVPGFSEYNFASDSMFRVIQSRNIPDNIYNGVWNNLLELAVAQLPRTTQLDVSGSLVIVFDILRGVQENLGAVSEEAWPLYRDLLDGDLAKEITQFLGAMEDYIGSGKTGMTENIRFFSSSITELSAGIHSTLVGLKRRFEPTPLEKITDVTGPRQQEVFRGV